MEKFLRNLMTEAEKNPILALGVAAGVMNAAAKLMRVHNEGVGSRAYAKDVDRRIKAASK